MSIGTRWRISVTCSTCTIRQGRFAEAEPIAQEVLDGSRRLLGDEHPDVLLNMHNLATIHDGLGRKREAEQLYLDTLDGERRVLGEAHPSTVITAARLATMYKVEGRFADAETLLLGVVGAFTIQGLPLNAQGSRVDIAGQLVELYDAWGRPGKAAEWRAKAVAKRP